MVQNEEMRQNECEKPIEHRYVRPELKFSYIIYGCVCVCVRASVYYVSNSIFGHLKQCHLNDMFLYGYSDTMNNLFHFSTSYTDFVH